MRKLVCSAVIENDQERRAILAWAQTVANAGFSEIGNVITVNYKTDDIVENCGTWWGIVAVFEQYPKHTISDTEV